MTDEKRTLVSDEETNLENVEHTGQDVELALDDLDDVAGGKGECGYQVTPPPGLLGSEFLWERMEQIRNRTFGR